MILCDDVANLLRLLRGELRQIDLSALTVRQVYLQGIEAQGASLAGAHVSESVFTVVGGGDLVITDPDKGSLVLDALGQRLGGSPFYAHVVWMVAVATVGWVVLTRTTYGNWTLAAGGRAGVAQSLGVPVGGVKIVSFGVAALLAGFSGCLQTAYLGSVTSAQGQDLVLLAITAIVVGGTSIHGGSGSVVGAVLGAVLVSLIQVGLILIGAPGTFYVTFIGLLLIAVVIGNSRLTLLQQWIRP